MSLTVKVHARVMFFLINASFAFSIADVDDIPGGYAEVNNEDEDNVVPNIPIAANNTVNVQLDADFYHHL